MEPTFPDKELQKDLYSHSEHASPVNTRPHSLQNDTVEPKAADAPSNYDPSSTEEKIGAPLEAVESSIYPTGLKLASILLAICLSVFLVALDMTIVATAVPRITADFKSLQDAGWYGSGFFLTVAAFQSTWGKAYKYFPLKPVFLVSIVIFEVGSLICGVAQNSTTLIVGRAIAGCGGAGIASGAYTILHFAVPPKMVAAYTGLVGATFSVASVIGPLLGGVFTQKVTWRWCFYVNLPIGGVSAAIIFLLFQAPKNSKPVKATLKEKLIQLDFAGAGLLMSSIVCFLLALQWGGTSKSWADSEVIGTLVGAALILAAFIGYEFWLDERSFLLPRLLKQRTMIVMIAHMSFVAGTFFVILYYLPLYFQSIDGVSATQSGVRNLPLILAIALFTVISGVLITFTGRYLEILVVGDVLTVISAGLIYTLSIGSSSKEWIGYQVMAGISIGATFQVPIIVGQGIAEASDVSSVTAIILFFQMLWGAVFITIAQTLFANKLLSAIPHNVPGLNPASVLAIGASELQSHFAGEQLAGVLVSYMAGLTDAFTLLIPLAGLATLVSIAGVVFDYRVLDPEALKNPGGAA